MLWLIAKDQRSSEADAPRLSDAVISTLPYTVTSLFRAHARSGCWTISVRGVRRGFAPARRTEGEKIEARGLRPEGGSGDRGWKREADVVDRPDAAGGDVDGIDRLGV